jgi:hypothetical protein
MTDNKQQSQPTQKPVIKCEAEKCPLQAEYKILTVTREKHFCCEIHWQELGKSVLIVSTERI